MPANSLVTHELTHKTCLLVVLPTLGTEFDDLALQRDGEHVLVVLMHADGGRDVQAAGERRAVDRVVAEGGAAVLVELEPALALVVHAERHPQLLCLRRLWEGAGERLVVAAAVGGD